MFGQYPLQVNGFKDLHECLEAAMIEGEIESLHSADNSARSGQEVSVPRLLFALTHTPHTTHNVNAKFLSTCSNYFLEVINKTNTLFYLCSKYKQNS